MKKITVKINQNGIIEPSNNYDRKYLIESIIFGKVYQCKITEGRSLKSLGLYWLIMAGLSYQYGGTEDYWHNYFKNLLLEKKVVNNILTGKIEMHVPSSAFEKMDEIKFKEYLTAITNILNEKGIDYKELIRNMKRDL